MCSLIGIPQYLWIVSGLVLDAIGFILLGWDLIHLQSDMKKRADENISIIGEFSEKYGGIQNWSEHIRKCARWVRPDEMLRNHTVDDEVAFNARSALEELSNLANCVEGVAENLSEFVELSEKNAERDKQAANRSLKCSIFGLGLIVFGFGLQIVGVLCA